MDFLASLYEGVREFARANPFIAGITIGLLVGAVLL